MQSENKIDKISPPVADTIITKSIFHNDERIDNYEWLKDDSLKDEKVLRYVKEENDYSESILESSKELKEILHKEISSFINSEEKEDSLIAVEKNGYFYYKRNEEGKDHPIYCRKKGSMQAAEEIYFDVNQYAKDHEYYDIGNIKISPDQKFMIFTVDTTGEERYILNMLDLVSGKRLEETNEGVDYVEWANDSRTFFYTLDNGEGMKPCRVFRHVVGTEMKHDELLFEEKDEAFEVEIKKFGNDKYIFLVTEKADVAEYYYFDADKPNFDFKMIISRGNNLDISVQTRGDKFYIWMRGESFPNGKIIETAVGNQNEKYWKEILPHCNEAEINYKFSVFKDFLVFTEKNLKLGLTRLGIIKFLANEIEYVKFPEEINVPELGINSKFDTDKIRVSYSSLTTPDTFYDYHVSTSKLEFIKQKKFKLYNPALYETKRLWVLSTDGVKVPVSVVYRKDLLKKDGSNPAYIYAYGCSGHVIEPIFHENMVPLLNRGVIFAIAHVRGGGMLGNKWHDDGKLLKRKNRAYDFIAVAEHLIENKYTSKNKIIASGASAGGELMLISANMRPDLFKVIIADVPSCDLLNKMLDSTNGGVIYFYDEIGNPQKREYYDYIKSYCPYENIRAVEYPNMFLRASLYDPRVSYWDPLRYTAKLREYKIGNSINILKTAMIGGHQGSGDWYENRAEEYAFALKILGINK